MASDNTLKLRTLENTLRNRCAGEWCRWDWQASKWVAKDGQPLHQYGGSRADRRRAVAREAERMRALSRLCRVDAVLGYPGATPAKPIGDKQRTTVRVIATRAYERRLLTRRHAEALGVNVNAWRQA